MNSNSMGEEFDHEEEKVDDFAVKRSLDSLHRESLNGIGIREFKGQKRKLSNEILAEILNDHFDEI